VTVRATRRRFPANTVVLAHSSTVTARDAFVNVAAVYSGTVAFRSSDPIAGLPASYAFTAADAGVHTFTVLLKRAGIQFIQAIDTVTGSIIGGGASLCLGASRCQPCFLVFGRMFKHRTVAKSRSESGYKISGRRKHGRDFLARERGRQSNRTLAPRR
jgi:hypothetical protein